MKNLNILKIVGQSLGRDLIVIAVKSYDSSANKIAGHSIHLFSDKESGITLYSNGEIVYGKYKKENEKAMDFVFNPKYKLPWTNPRNLAAANYIKERVEVLTKDNSEIAKKHQAVKLLIANYEDFLSYCIENKYMRFNQLNYLSTQEKYKHILVASNEKEAVVETAISEDKDLSKYEDNIKTLRDKAKKSIMGLAHEIRKYYIAKDEEFAKGDYQAQMKFALKEAWGQTTHAVEEEMEAAIEKTVEETAEEKTEVSVTKTDNVIPLLVLDRQDKLNPRVLKNRIPGKTYVTFKPGYVYYEDCCGTVLHTIGEFKDVVLNGKTLEEREVYFTQKYMINIGMVAAIDPNFVIVRTQDDIFVKAEEENRLVITEKQ